MASALKQNLSPEEVRLAARYGGRKPASHLDRFRQAKGRKHYFDSGDYAIAQAGKGGEVEGGTVGSQHPSPESIPHPATPVVSASNSGPGAKVPGLVTGITGPQQHPPGQAQTPVQGAGSPIKETSFLSRETSADELEAEDDDVQCDAVDKNSKQAREPGEPARPDTSQAGGLPIRT